MHTPNNPSFCSSHRHSCSHEEQNTFRLHRDIIHTLLLPLFLLHTRASQVASSALPPCTQTPIETERAFRGDARSAYSWLHCILIEERDCYLTERCPACIVLHVLHSEPTIRFVAVACLLADHLQESSDARRAKRRLPAFDFWFKALETAVCEDPFWGDSFWPDIEHRAAGLADGVKQVAFQCLEMQAVMTERECFGSAAVESSSCPVESCPPPVDVAAPPQPTLTRKQIRLAREEQREQRRRKAEAAAAEQCWQSSRWSHKIPHHNNEKLQLFGDHYRNSSCPA